jgi:predicted acetyltransferase
VFPRADFKTWYLKGYWSDHYIPHSIIRDNNIIANVSISKMKILINGKCIKGIQLGTVGTLAGYRNQGLSRLLMTHDAFLIADKKKDIAIQFDGSGEILLVVELRF